MYFSLFLIQVVRHVYSCSVYVIALSCIPDPKILCRELINDGAAPRRASLRLKESYSSRTFLHLRNAYATYRAQPDSVPFALRAIAILSAYNATDETTRPWDVLQWEMTRPITFIHSFIHSYAKSAALLQKVTAHGSNPVGSSARTKLERRE